MDAIKVGNYVGGPRSAQTNAKSDMLIHLKGPLHRLSETILPTFSEEFVAAQKHGDNGAVEREMFELLVAEKKPARHATIPENNRRRSPPQLENFGEVRLKCMPEGGWWHARMNTDLGAGIWQKEM